MRRSAIILARVLGYIEIFDLLSGKQVFFPDLVREIAERYQFQKFPKDIQELDLARGVEFLMGRSGHRAISKFVIWDSLMVLETSSNTSDSKALLEEILCWGVDKFGLNYEPRSIKRHAYISDVTFYSDAPLLTLNLAVRNLSASTSQALSEIWQEPVQYDSVSLKIGHDPTTRRNGIAPFSIERRAEARFSENKYFSEAPLPTDMHLQLLEQFERDILRSAKAGQI